MGDQTGTIWEIDADGQIHDTKKLTAAMQMAFDKLAKANAKGGGGGSGATSAKAASADFEYIQNARAAGLPDQEIFDSLDLRYGGSEKEINRLRAAQDFMNDTRGTVEQNSLLNDTFSKVFGLPLPTQKAAPAPFLVPKKKDAAGQYMLVAPREYNYPDTDGI
jgi:hypothetical protein